MTMAAMKALVMEQLQEDAADVAERDTLISAYIDDGYMELMTVRKRGLAAAIKSITATEGNELPARYHQALVDYATYRVLSIGNVQKQQRGQFFLGRFLNTKNTMQSERDELAENGDELLGIVGNDGNWKFRNLYI